MDNISKSLPLAKRMRPININEIVGQKHIIISNSLLYKMITQDSLYSILLYEPPGTGKTSVAKVIAQTTNSNFEKLNVVAAAKKDIEKVIDNAKTNLENNIRTVLFIDEIHRFNKAQQGYLLPYVEDGNGILGNITALHGVVMHES